ncbi:uncharacterized protein LOC131934568 [Physella acuta]|uniref:uncharacterized protein LOC131934568 n=1 Tax=Physella acuta TaxID=109671 RepID=UPI0027DD5CCC|nr:uncharacterized protein LOC131934568 [Physella acuta]
MQVSNLCILGIFAIQLITVADGQRTCYYLGVTYKHGDVYRPMSAVNNCSDAICDNGGFRPANPGCNLDGKCYKVGEQFQVKCSILVCVQNKEAKYSYSKETVTIGCRDSNNQCRFAGDSFRETVTDATFKECKCVGSVYYHDGTVECGDIQTG